MHYWRGDISTSLDPELLREMGVELGPFEQFDFAPTNWYNCIMPHDAMLELDKLQCKSWVDLVWCDADGCRTAATVKLADGTFACDEHANLHAECPCALPEQSCPTCRKAARDVHGSGDDELPY